MPIESHPRGSPPWSGRVARRWILDRDLSLPGFRDVCACFPARGKLSARKTLRDRRSRGRRIGAILAIGRRLDRGVQRAGLRRRRVRGARRRRRRRRLQAQLQLVLLRFRPQAGDTLVPELLRILHDACEHDVTHVIIVRTSLQRSAVRPNYLFLSLTSRKFIYRGRGIFLITRAERGHSTENARKKRSIGEILMSYFPFHRLSIRLISLSLSQACYIITYPNITVLHNII